MVTFLPKVKWLKFGKKIQQRQLDLPEYAGSFVNYKALKKLIKQLSATPKIPAQGTADVTQEALNPQAALRANKEVFFFRLEREIEKVNACYLQKEAEFSLRLKTLSDKKRVIQSRVAANSNVTANSGSLVGGFQQFDSDLNKLQQFVEVSETAASKILKKWDKTSKSRMKELYLHRAVEVQPCFNRDVLRDLSDRATTARLELEAWAEGENIQFDAARPTERIGQLAGAEENESDLQILQAAAAGNQQKLREWIGKLQPSTDARDRVTRTFLVAINEFPDDVLEVLLMSGLVDLHAEDDINGRNCLHEAAISGRSLILRAGLLASVDVSRSDVYGRLPLHYACMHGRVEMVRELLDVGPQTVDFLDHDNFTPLIHSIVKDQLASVEQLLFSQARLDPASESDHIPLNLACQHGSIPTVKMLLERRAALLPDAEGLYPQHLVARSGQTPELLLLLKQHGANLDQKDKLYQWTPLFHAGSEGHVTCLRTLLELGVNPLAVDEKGLPAMYYAAWEGHLECMVLLWSSRSDSSLPHRPFDVLNGLQLGEERTSLQDEIGTVTAIPAEAETADGIPDLSLPPPIIPLRRYGHNFLDTKAFVQIYLEQSGLGSIVFNQAARYPAARLTISSKLSDVIPRTIMLPIQDDSKTVSFQVDNLDTFAVDFEIFPTFGSKVIAKSVALPYLFTAESSSAGSCCLPLFDPRLRSIGHVRFNFQVIKPYYGDPLEITHFATYWKATSAFDSDRNGLITGSSLSGDYVQLFVQLTKDRRPVLHPLFTLNHHGVDIPICCMSYDQFTAVGCARGVDQPAVLESLRSRTVDEIANLYKILSTSFLSLRDVLSHLSSDTHINLSILYPSVLEEQNLGMGTIADINSFADAILTDVFNHARASKERNPDFMRSIVFTSYNPNICTALNWKQPNYPVLLCNDLGQTRDLAHDVGMQPVVHSSGRASMSIKESARIAQSNNFMGLICRSSLLNVMPALVKTITEQGLVLVADTSDETGRPTRSEALAVADSMGVAAEWAYRMPEGVNGVMKANGVLRFNDAIDM